MFQLILTNNMISILKPFPPYGVSTRGIDSFASKQNAQGCLLALAYLRTARNVLNPYKL